MWQYKLILDMPTHPCYIQWTVRRLFLPAISFPGLTLKILHLKQSNKAVTHFELLESSETQRCKLDSGKISRFYSIQFTAHKLFCRTYFMSLGLSSDVVGLFNGDFIFCSYLSVHMSWCWFVVWGYMWILSFIYYVNTFCSYWST